jgi:hypothetical protein
MESDMCSSSDSENDIIESDKSKRKKKFKYKLGNFCSIDYFIYIILNSKFQYLFKLFCVSGNVVDQISTI